MLKPNLPGKSSKSFLSRVDLPVPEGPQITMGRSAARLGELGRGAEDGRVSSLKKLQDQSKAHLMLQRWNGGHWREARSELELRAALSISSLTLAL